MSDTDPPLLHFPSEEELEREARERAEARRRRDEEELGIASLELLERFDDLLDETVREGADEAVADVVQPEQAPPAGRVRAVVNTVSEAIVTFSADGRIQSFNRGAERMFGIRAEAAIGTRFSTLLPPELQAADYPLTDVDTRAEELPTQIVAEAVARRADGQTLPVEFSFGVVVVSGVWYGAVVIRDISERKRFEAQLRQLNAELQSQVDQTREALKRLEQTQAQLVEAEKQAALGVLVAGVAHEINTPLGVAITAVSSAQAVIQELRALAADGRLKKSQLDADTAMADEGLTSALRNLQRTADLVQHFKQLAVNMDEEPAETIELGAFVDERIAAARQRATEAGCELRRVGAGVTVTTRVGALARIVDELVANALSHAFAEPGGVVEIQIEGDAERWCLRVVDEGVGVAPDQVERVFEPFVTSARGRGHMGLGLPLVYALASRILGGRLRCVPASGGAVFELQVPAAEN